MAHRQCLKLKTSDQIFKGTKLSWHCSLMSPTGIVPFPGLHKCKTYDVVDNLSQKLKELWQAHIPMCTTLHLLEVAQCVYHLIHLLNQEFETKQCINESLLGCPKNEESFQTQNF